MGVSILLILKAVKIDADDKGCGDSNNNNS